MEVPKVSFVAGADSSKVADVSFSSWGPSALTTSVKLITRTTFS